MRRRCVEWGNDSFRNVCAGGGDFPGWGIVECFQYARQLGDDARGRPVGMGNSLDEAVTLSTRRDGADSPVRRSGGLARKRGRGAKVRRKQGRDLGGHRRRNCGSAHRNASAGDRKYPGAILGAFIAAWVVELVKKKPMRSATWAAVGAALGKTMGITVKFACGFVVWLGVIWFAWPW